MKIIRMLFLIIPALLVVLALGVFLVHENAPPEGEPSEGRQDCPHSDEYGLKLVMPTSFGLLEQLALLPNGDIVFGDSANDRILLFRNNTLETITAGVVKASAVAPLPDGRIAYIKDNGVSLLDYKTKQEERLGGVPGDRYLQALGSDKHGNVYAGAAGGGLFRFKEGRLDKLADPLPFSDLDTIQITDIAIGIDGTVYVAGFEKVFSVDSAGNVQLVADGLVNEPVWVEAGPDGTIYINEISQGLQRFDPKTKRLGRLNTQYQFADMLALAANELFVYDSVGVLYTLDLQTDAVKPLYTNAGNDFAFAAGANDTAFLATPPLHPVLKQHMIRLSGTGERADLYNLEYAAIFAADIDSEDRLNLLTSEGIARLEHNGSVRTIPLRIEGRDSPMLRSLAVGRGLWYVTATDFSEKIEVFSVDENGEVRFLPINFTRASFGAYAVDDARIDVAPDGSLALIATAKGSASQGPYIQRVYRADADGSDLREIARLDSGRVAGMVDIAVGPDNSVFVLTMQGESNYGSDSIYKIDGKNKVTEAVDTCLGRDPESIDVDPAGNIWFGSTLGVFKVEPLGLRSTN